MRIDESFQEAYRELEKRMRTLAEEDGDGFLPSVEPEGPVQYVIICMEPSLSRRAGAVDQLRTAVNAGHRNFLYAIEDSILHFCIRNYLCGPSDRYHITDISKGAMLVKLANVDRKKRWDRWYALLQEEIDLIAAPNASFIAVGNEVTNYLKQQKFPRTFNKVIHYSRQAGRARKEGIRDHEADFQVFRNSVSIKKVIDATGDFLTSARVPGRTRVPAEIRNEVLSHLEKSELTTSRQQLIFNYKLAFEKMKKQREDSSK